MVKKRKYKKRRRKSYRKLKTSVAVIRMPSIMPDSIYVNMKYNTAITMTSLLGIGTYVFSMNSIFDPDFTGVGHQPLGHDQWSAFCSVHFTIIMK